MEISVKFLLPTANNSTDKIPVITNSSYYLIEFNVVLVVVVAVLFIFENERVSMLESWNLSTSTKFIG